MKLSIGQKLMGSFLILSLIGVAAGLTGLTNVKKVARSGDVVLEEKLPFKDVAMEAIISAERTLNACRSYLLANTGLEVLEEEINEHLGDFDMFVSMVEHGTESEAFRTSPAGQMYVKDGLEITVPQGSEEMLALVEKLRGPQAVFTETAQELIRVHKQRVQYSFTHQGTHYDLPAFLYASDLKHRRWFQQLEEATEYGVDFTGQLDPTKCFFGTWYSAFETDDPELKKLLDDFRQTHAKIHAVGRNVVSAEESMKASMLERGRRYSTKVQKALEKLQKYAEQKIEETESQQQVLVTAMFEASEKMNGLLDQLEELADKGMTAAQAQATEAKEYSVKMLKILMGVAVLLAIVLGYFVNRAVKSIVGPIKRAVAGLTEMGGQVSSASGQVSSASQALAEGTSEQAASLEETSSSLEEMASMTKANAGNAKQADNLMQEASKVVTSAKNSMDELTSSMDEIFTASEETSKIIKTIDEIAFQTNLLALNAAVEAARAGEAGAGFAVVADEVRNLAMRAADAAKNTADLIEGTVKKVKGGAELVTKTNDAFAEVSQNATKVGELVGEIAAASNEQAQGIEQVNKAVTEMDKVVQGAAANAEESASASEELFAQAEQMKGFVDDLANIVGGNEGNGQAANTSTQVGQKAFVAKSYHGVKTALSNTTEKAKTQVKQLTEGTDDGWVKPQPEAESAGNDTEFRDF